MSFAGSFSLKMEVSNVLGGLRASSKDGGGCALLTNGIGGFALVTPSHVSRYEGVFAMRRLGEPYRFVESIHHDDPVVSVTNRLWSVIRRRKSFTESLFMPPGRDALLYSASKEVDVRIFLDCKHPYDSREWGRHYSVDDLPQGALFSFSKKADHRDPPPRQDICGDYDLFVALHAPECRFTEEEVWVERSYDEDRSRNSPPFSRYVYSPGRVTSRSFVLGLGFTKAQAITNSLKTWIGKDDLLRIKESDVRRWLGALKGISGKTALAFACAASSLESLSVNHKNTYAGLPWFFQFWARDSAVSSKGLSMIGRKEMARRLLLDQVARISKGVNLTNFFVTPGELQSNVYCLDGILWTYLRLEWLYDEDPSSFSREELAMLKARLSDTIAHIDSQMRDGLIFNGPKETWMDTEFAGDDRAGARIEMQCLALAMFRFAKKLGIPPSSAAGLKERVKKVFWTGGCLCDGKDDPTVRPNLFIAAYAFPELLSKKEWVSCFDVALGKLWLDWGGLASIAKDHPLFTPDSTGEDVRSYHRGDSWFWVNNLSALVLHRADAVRYRKYVSKILEASTKELLFMGAAGHHAEVSSASHLSSKGCLAQAWSDALYIELLNEMFS